MTSSVRILIVDDTLLARTMLRKIVSKLCPEWEIVEAKEGADALSKVEGTSIDVALIDYNMPGMTGLELARKLALRYPALSMALVTANIQDYIAEEAKAIGVDFIEKPIEPERIRQFLVKTGKLS